MELGLKEMDSPEELEKFLVARKTQLEPLIDSGVPLDEVIMGDDDLREIEELLGNINSENISVQKQVLLGEISPQTAAQKKAQFHARIDQIKASPAGQLWAWVYSQVIKKSME